MQGSTWSAHILLLTYFHGACCTIGVNYLLARPKSMDYIKDYIPSVTELAIHGDASNPVYNRTVSSGGQDLKLLSIIQSNRP